MISAPMPRLVAALALSAAVLAGCGPAATSNSAKSFNGPQKDVATAIDDFSKAVSNNDQKKICDTLLARALVLKLNSRSTTCTSAVSDQLDAAGDAKINVKRITITGTNATADVVSKYDGHDRASTLLLTNEGGGWKLSGVR